jgi:putative secretion ATPase (PEP-CTERM system associated)
MYETFYGLTGKPFQLNPDPAFLFASKGHSSAYAYLKYGVFQGEGFIVVTGEIGAGKTTLVRALLEELDPNRVVAAQLVSTMLDSDNLLRAVATAFGLAVRGEDKAHLLAGLEAFLTSLVTQNKRALLVVDEAQNLTPQGMEELRMLSNFQFGDRALLQSFLVGQPELRDLMRAPTMQQLRQRIIASYHLGPMDKAETRAYVEHRLQRVGWKGDPGFEDEAFGRIYDATGGIPRRINQLCNRLLLSAYLAEKHALTLADVDEVAKEIGSELSADPPRAPVMVLPTAQRASVGGEPVSMDFASLAATVDRMDGNIEVILDMLQSIVRPSGRGKPGAKSGGSSGA